MRAQLPYARAGQVIGLLGGSFDPAHGGHVHITTSALKRFGLDRVWWLVSPGNPLKARGPAPLAQRVAHAARLARDPRITVTDIEARIGTRYTAETLQALQRLYPGVTFVWLMGADNLAQFDRWDNWRWIMNNVPIGVMARPGDRMAARHAKAAEIYRYAQLRGRASHSLAWGPAPRWSFINIPMNNSSSTEIRAKGDWT